jgi:hypothetical protein
MSDHTGWHPSADDGVGWVAGGGHMSTRLWTTLTLALMLTWQSRQVRVGSGRWLAMIARYQLNTGGRSALADEHGSYSQRAAARALRRGTLASVLVTISGALITVMGPYGPQRFKRGGW